MKDLGKQQKPTAKQKQRNIYRNASPDVLSRRRAQNRAAQQAYRNRKEQRIKDLEVMLSDANQRNDVLKQTYTALYADYISLMSLQIGYASYPQQFNNMPYGGVGNIALGSLKLNAPTSADGLGSIDTSVYSDLNTAEPTL